MAAWEQLNALPKPLVGLVARPQLFARVQAEAGKYAGPFGPVPVYQKEQDADCLAFYDAKRLRDYLSSNSQISNGGKPATQSNE